MDGLGVVGPVIIPSLGKEGALAAALLVVAPSTVVMLVVLVRSDKALAALTMTDIVIAKPASVVLGSTMLGKTDPAAIQEGLATLVKIEQTLLPEQRRYVLTSKRHRQ
ncbi:hypothetical protein PC116_g12995 [Phytophthora cactorum]|uniref:Uncharacterized protein n=1 Tax=Phytophthora cactorum TaxID=29920 RepID=A0A8T1KUD4_9STRA|nr:hypothetical protein Pcac1_g5351 [Phytophthora cactorum]KAG2825851.1 hypothetical protein PC112_g9530 [Phytophthora cactorum]KAG2828001.1 hypothetical protein PC111_g8351 [Phytophthora cactorum]KAG2858447.1 hypothetical protein PC113_g9811 [Phytophthora cactorum]KAG2908334.1 hypothetical protein PC114_g10498 [Phytophthora cactorum]